MKTVMFYSVYLNVPWIAVLSCVEFNLRGDIFLFNPPKKKTKNKKQQPKLPKISTSQTEKVEEVGSREQLCLQEYSETLNCISGSACSFTRRQIYFHLWCLNAKSDRRL